MKKIMLALLVAGVSFSAIAADKIHITGKPVLIEKRGDIYHAPDTLTTTTTYQYVTIDGTNRVCYAERQPNFVKLEPSNIEVMIAGQKKTWTCYTADPTYFMIEEVR